MKPKCELYLSSFFCSSFVAQSSLVSIALVYSRNTHDFCFLSRANPSGLREMKVSRSPSSKSMLFARWFSSGSFLNLVLFCSSPGDRISCNPMYSRIL